MLQTWIVGDDRLPNRAASAATVIQAAAEQKHFNFLPRVRGQLVAATRMRTANRCGPRTVVLDNH
jgi:hypothetical protein